MTNKEKFDYLKLNFEITEKEFRNFVLLGAKAHSKIERMRESPLVLTSPSYVSVNVQRIQTRQDFEKRVAKYEKILSPDYRNVYNAEIEKKFYEMVYDLSDGDISLIENIYSKWRKMSVREKKKFFDENYDLRRVINYKSEYDDELSDLVGNDYEKLSGRLSDYA